MKNYYKVLGVTPSATAKDIKKAYRALAKKHHPDANPDDENAAQKFKELTEAYGTLSDPSKKATYDRSGNQQDFPGGFDDLGFNPFDFFRNQKRQKGPDTETRISVDFMDSIRGSDVPVKILDWSTCTKCSNGLDIKEEDCKVCNGTGEIVRRQGALGVRFSCRTCHGTGKKVQDCRACFGRGLVSSEVSRVISLPPGIDNDTMIRIPGMGMPNRMGGNKGDLLIRVKVNPHDAFARSGQDIHIKARISYTMACLGGEKIVPTLDGNVSVKIPAGVQNGRTIRLKGRGVRLAHRSPGDQFCHLEIDVIKKPTERIKEILETLEAEVSRSPTQTQE